MASVFGISRGNEAGTTEAKARIHGSGVDGSAPAAPVGESTGRAAADAREGAGGIPGHLARGGRGRSARRGTDRGGNGDGGGQEYDLYATIVLYDGRDDGAGSAADGAPE